jgi:hypothetical protein
MDVIRIRRANREGPVRLPDNLDRDTVDTKVLGALFGFSLRCEPGNFNNLRHRGAPAIG